jgi:hypothetical protein
MLDIEIGGLTVGTEYDQLRVLGNALLAGTLDVDLINGFNPTTDADFTILLTGFFGPGQVIGTFDTLDLPGSSLGIWTVDYFSDRVVLDFDAPEPPTFLLVIVGLGIVGMMRGSRRQLQMRAAPMRDVRKWHFSADLVVANRSPLMGVRADSMRTSLRRPFVTQSRLAPLARVAS